jgi:spore coat protein CotF
MPLQLSQKERMLLEDDKHQEEICVKKYQNYSNQTKDTQLKQLFTKLSGEEQHHLNIINEMLQGKEPNLSHANMPQAAANMTGNSNYNGAMGNECDDVLCSDLLATEKYVSGTYDTGIFEAACPPVRQALQHIQQEEQQHGEQLFNYMNSHGMYNVK